MIYKSISQYTIETWGNEQEDKYLDLIFAKINEIAEFPSQFMFRENLYDKCQCASVGKHVIFFKIQSDYVVISRILHQTMDYHNHF